MNKSEYIKELGKRLKYIPREDREDALEYYTELMSDMGFDEKEDVTVKLGNPKDTAKKIMDECTQKHVNAYEEKKTVKGQALIIWLTVISILSLPVSLPLSIVVLSLAFTGLIVFIALLIAFVATGISLVIAGLACFAAMWTVAGAAQKLVVLGMGLGSLAIGILVCFGIFSFVRMLIRKIFRRNTIENKEA